MTEMRGPYDDEEEPCCTGGWEDPYEVEDPEPPPEEIVEWAASHGVEVDRTDLGVDEVVEDNYDEESSP